MPKENEFVNIRTSLDANNFWCNAFKYNKISSSFRIIKDTYNGLDEINLNNKDLYDDDNNKDLYDDENNKELYNDDNQICFPSKIIDTNILIKVLSDVEFEKEKMNTILQNQQKEIKFLKNYQIKLLKINDALARCVSKLSK